MKNLNPFLVQELGGKAFTKHVCCSQCKIGLLRLSAVPCVSLCLTDINTRARSHRPSPSIFAHRKPSKTGGGKACSLERH